MFYSAKRHLAIWASLIGNALEWYEFYIYVQFAPLLTILFFPKESSTVALLQVFFVFAFSFLSRAIGTFVFAHIGDRFGRRIALLSSILLMTIPTFMMGFIPTYAQIGVIAPILIACLRLLQGLPAGGESSGVMCYLIEISPPNRQGMIGSFAFLGAQIGAILSILEFLLLKKLISHDLLLDWGWRISFILGGLIGLGGWFLRQKLKETPLFKVLEEEKRTLKRPVLETLKTHKIPILKAFFLSALSLAGWYLIFIFTPIYSAEFLSSRWEEELLIILGMIVLSNIFLPIFGALADQGYTRVLWISGSIGVILLAYPFFYHSLHHHFGILLLFKAAMVLLLTAQFAPLPMLMCNLFPTSVRFSGVGIGYNFCSILLGGSTPFVALFFTNLTHDPYVPAYMLIATALFSLIAFLTLKPNARREQHLLK